MKLSDCIASKKVRKGLKIVLIVIVVAVVGVLLAKAIGRASVAAERSARQTLLKQLGQAFKLYAENDPEGRWPHRAIDAWLPNMEQLGPYLEQAGNKQELLDYLHGKRGVQLCYLGHAVVDDAYGMALLEAYQKNNAEDIVGKPISVESVANFMKKTSS